MDARTPISTAINLALAPARLSGHVVSGLVRQVAGGGRESAPPAPKSLDDATIARKVETVVFRNRRVAKAKVDVNIANGVVWLRGEVATPNLVNALERQASEIPEVERVENLLRLPKTPRPTRTDTPARQRKSRRSKPRSADPALPATGVSGEAPAPPGAEPSPRELSKTRTGRQPAPLGSHGEGESEQEDRIT